MTTAKQPFLPFFVGDFVAATSEWEGEAISLYATLLLHQWALGSIPADPKRVCKLVRWDWELFESHWKVVRRKFEPVEREVEGELEQRLINMRLEEHRGRTIELSKKKSESGSRGAAKRWQKPVDNMAKPSKKNGTSHKNDMAKQWQTDGECHEKEGCLPIAPGIASIPSQSYPSQSSEEVVVDTSVEPLPEVAGSAGPHTGDSSAKDVGTKRKTRRLPSGYPTEPFREWARINVPDVHFDQEIAILRDHEFRDAHSDWDAVIRNWLRRALKAIRPPASSRQTGMLLGNAGTITHEQREHQELQALMARRSGIGLPDFRDPLPGESAQAYRNAQNAEWEKRKTHRANVGALGAGALKRVVS